MKHFLTKGTYSLTGDMTPVENKVTGDFRRCCKRGGPAQAFGQDCIRGSKLKEITLVTIRLFLRREVSGT